MNFFKKNFKKSILLIISALLLLNAAGCAVQVVTEDEPLLEMMPDIGFVTEKPIEDDRFGDDLIIDIEKPDILGGGDKETEDTEGTSQPETDVTSGDTTEPDGSDTDADTNKPATDTDDETDIDDYEGSDDEEETEDDEDDDVFDPNDIEFGENSGAVKFYDVPLSEAKQMYVIQMAEEFDIPPELIFGVMYVETRYRENVNSANGKYLGIMQIAKSNLKRLNKKFGITDLTDYLQNVKAGAYYLSYYWKKYDKNIDKTLMCYHCGEGGAISRWNTGWTQDGYCRKVRKEIARIQAAQNAD